MAPTRGDTRPSAQRQPSLNFLPGGAGMITGRLQRDVVWQSGAERPGAVMKCQIDRLGQIVRRARRCSRFFRPCRASGPLSVSRPLTWINAVLCQLRSVPPAHRCHPGHHSAGCRWLSATPLAPARSSPGRPGARPSSAFGPSGTKRYSRPVLASCTFRLIRVRPLIRHACAASLRPHPATPRGRVQVHRRKSPRPPAGLARAGCGTG